MSIFIQSIQKTPLFLRVVALYLIAGSLIWGGSQMATVEQPNSVVAYAAPLPSKPESKVTPAVATEAISGTPVRVTVSRLNIDLPVENGSYDEKTGKWTLGNNTAYYATVSDLPSNQTGSIFIYGHNNKSAFAGLSHIAVGDVVTLRLGNTHTISYSFSHDERVTPEATNVLFETSEQPRLVIMTCEGIFSNVRRIMYFDYKESA
ncbi:MAG: hypothetical protein JWO54_897 [Candidatus Saccharibacteria bacterium]|nr:hypothetical protein [Candidatus Saccharibacteria bacterium]